jgi:hypothetical protein
VASVNTLSAAFGVFSKPSSKGDQFARVFKPIEKALRDSGTTDMASMSAGMTAPAA